MKRRPYIVSNEEEIQAFVIDGGLPTLNEYINAERSNKFAAATIKRDATNLVVAHVKASGIKKMDDGVFVVMVWNETNKRKDKDNIGFAKKFVFDGLVKSGIIKNDGWDNIKGYADHFHLDRKAKHRSVEVTLINKP